MNERRNLILVLEDKESRLALMRESIASLPHGFEIRHWDDSFAMRTEAPDYFARTCLISLDCDLSRGLGPRRFSGRDGMDAVLFVNSLEPFGPVLVHTSLAQAADLVTRALKARGWRAAQVALSKREDFLDWVNAGKALIGCQSCSPQSGPAGKS
jgi:hypothetical protein